MPCEIFTVGEGSFFSSLDRNSAVTCLERDEPWTDLPDLAGGTFTVNRDLVVGVIESEVI